MSKGPGNEGGFGPGKRRRFWARETKAVLGRRRFGPKAVWAEGGFGLGKRRRFWARETKAVLVVTARPEVKAAMRGTGANSKARPLAAQAGRGMRALVRVGPAPPELVSRPRRPCTTRRARVAGPSAAAASSTGTCTSLSAWFHACRGIPCADLARRGWTRCACSQGSDNVFLKRLICARRNLYVLRSRVCRWNTWLNHEYLAAISCCS